MDFFKRKRIEAGIPPRKKDAEVDRVCPLCRVFGRNINLYDVRDTGLKIQLLIGTCMACKGLYHIDTKGDT